MKLRFAYTGGVCIDFEDRVAVKLVVKITAYPFTDFFRFFPQCISLLKKE